MASSFRLLPWFLRNFAKHFRMCANPVASVRAVSYFLQYVIEQHYEIIDLADFLRYKGYKFKTSRMFEKGLELGL